MEGIRKTCPQRSCSNSEQSLGEEFGSGASEGAEWAVLEYVSLADALNEVLRGSEVAV